MVEPSFEFEFGNWGCQTIIKFEIDIHTFTGKCLFSLPVIMPCTISLIFKIGSSYCGIIYL